MKNKKGQLAVFVLIALAIVGAILLIFWLNKSPSVENNIELNPIPFLKSCIEPEIRTSVFELSQRGGYSNPEGAIEFDGINIKYLCYASLNYQTCVIQQPLIKEHFEKEVKTKIDSKAKECFENLKNEYDKKGYSVEGQNSNSEFSIGPSNMQFNYLSPMTIKKGDTSRTFNGFNIELDSQMYDLLMTSVSIIDYEATYGDSETTLYLQYYPNLKIEKFRVGDGSKIYTLSNVASNESFRFAVRSLVWPPGYEL